MLLYILLSLFFDMVCFVLYNEYILFLLLDLLKVVDNVDIVFIKLFLYVYLYMFFDGMFLKFIYYVMLVGG